MRAPADPAAHKRWLSKHEHGATCRMPWLAHPPGGLLCDRCGEPVHPALDDGDTTTHPACDLRRTP